MSSHNIWTITHEISVLITYKCVFQQCAVLTSVDSDEPVQPPVKNRNSK